MNTKPGIIGKKLGMTQLYKDDGTVQRVTVVDVSSVIVVGKRTKEKDGYTALVLGMTDAKDKHLTKAQQGSFKKAGVAAKRTVRELRCDEEFLGKFEIGAAPKLDEIFQVGQIVDAQGTTRGRGFSGVVRRWSFAGFVQTHGTHEYRRHGGSIGTNMTPGRTLPNLKMPGQYGNETVSILNLRVARIDAEKNLLLIEGGIPGSKNQLVTVRSGVKARIKKG
ncbi:LSU ribosomal protein L3p (L3e) [Labilithrix luteola]|uniref:Large ribosomal subunit protein uL3 n=1 Tax=Labilithrix luteola TaxID=1391654 RepID=A0A0K1PYM5_9BACT|nr:50S ribosomal protein L3 [Labilithrix luteola]AKU98633.1 LSU ribosomal protein L3p (L3e) [Labilithrix luteola]